LAISSVGTKSINAIDIRSHERPKTTPRWCTKHAGRGGQAGLGGWARKSCKRLRGSLKS
jgi:hypothetical protein